MVAATTLLVVTSSWPRTGDEIAGTFVRVDALVRAREGNRVLVAAPSGAGVARGGDGIEVVDLPHLGLFGSPGAATRPHRAFGVVPFARALSRLPRPDRIVAHWLLPCGLLARKAFPDVPCELIAHGADVRLLEALPRPIARALVVRLARGATLRAVSEGIAERLAAIAPSVRTVVAPIPIAIDVEGARARAVELRKRAGDRLNVVAGRLIAGKRIERAIDHVATFGGKLILVGDGPRKDRLVAEARGRRVDVIATGAVRHDEALAWIAAADHVLAPLAKGEGAPTIVREARALGVPVVVFP